MPPISHYARAWNALEAYNKIAVVGRLHEAFSLSASSARRDAADDVYQVAQTPGEVFWATWKRDIVEGNDLALHGGALVTLPVDLIVGTGRVRPTDGPSAKEHLEQTLWAVGDHPTDLGLAGAVVLGLALGSGVIGGVWGIAEGVPRGLLAAAFGWLFERRPPRASMTSAFMRTVESRFYQATVVGAAPQILALHAARLATGLLKVAIAGCGAMLGLCVGLVHSGWAAAYTACFPRLAEALAADPCPV